MAAAQWQLLLLLLRRQTRRSSLVRSWGRGGGCSSTAGGAVQAGGGGPRLAEDRCEDQGTPSEMNRARLGHTDTRIQLHTGTQTHGHAHTHTHKDTQGLGDRHTRTHRNTKTWNRDSGGRTQTDRHGVSSHTDTGTCMDLDLPWLEFSAQNTAPQLGSQGW